MNRIKTKYPGVYYIMSPTGAKQEKIYYILYRKNGKLIEEKAGRQFQDDMTPARAAGKRARRVEGKEPTNNEKRIKKQELKAAEGKKWTVDRLWRAYKGGKDQTKSLKTDESRYKKHLKEIFGLKEPKEILQLDLDRLRIRMLKKWSPQTVKHVLALLRRIINYGVTRGLCDDIPFKIVLPRVDNKKTEDLTKEQLKRLLKAIDADTNIQAKNIMRMVLCTGMRRGELFKLKWNDIDWERGFINIRKPKGGKDQSIPLNKSAQKILESHPKTDSPYVFPGQKGRQRTDIHKDVKRIKDSAGLPKDFRALHGLRHFYASMLASSGKIDMYTLQRLLTHKSPAMTQRYAHLRDEALRKAANLTDELLMQADITMDRTGKYNTLKR